MLKRLLRFMSAGRPNRDAVLPPETRCLVQLLPPEELISDVSDAERAVA